MFVDFELPGCNPGETGSAVVKNVNGDVCSEVAIGEPGIESVCDGTDATLSYSFLLFEGTACEQLLERTITVSCDTGISGCTDPTACNYNPEAVCDDGLCYTQDVCCPEPLSFSFPSYLCGGDNVVCIEFDSDVTSSVDSILLYDENGVLDDGAEIISIEDNTICVALTNPNASCGVMTTQLSLAYDCLGTPPGAFIVDIGEIKLFPDQSLFIPVFEEYVYEECANIPQLLEPSSCFTNVNINYIEPDNCNPSGGLFTWEALPSFDISTAPDCFLELTNFIPIAPCPNIPSNGTISIKAIDKN